jgi:acetoin utilization deacetylase AcuC-like enzyme
VSLGVDAAGVDPESPLEVSTGGFGRAGELLAGLGLPTVLVHEGATSWAGWASTPWRCCRRSEGWVQRRSRVPKVTQLYIRSRAADHTR